MKLRIKNLILIIVTIVLVVIAYQQAVIVDKQMQYLQSNKETVMITFGGFIETNTNYIKLINN